ncbi:hypothetical protein NEMBOFW57_000343 [Staphylotrichum longicolle]|uniref:Uncharacterized protein n=1 Tax=Staphylotrichum longicolle TaxID=669026 RepID=A0AAD4I2U6_9PEZI|nr:hypothetical protein NEMBOFW57_000343 [Staphylotrichum longicolle]
MDLTWRTAAWDATGKQTNPPTFQYHANRSAFAVQISQAAGNDRITFVQEKHCRVVQTEKQWDDYLEEDRKIYYNLRTTNTLSSDTALTLTHLPSRNRTYAILFGYTPRQANSVLERLAYATTTTSSPSSSFPGPTAVTDPLMLLTTFIQLEKVIRFEHVERQADAMASLVRNFSLGHRHGRGHADDPRDLVGLAADMTGLRNGLVGWKREVEGFGERMARLSGGGAAGGEDEREYLERTAEEYGAMTFMSMGLFNWHPKEGESVLSPWWYVYFIVAGGLTAAVFIVYFFWSRISAAVFRFQEGRKLDQSIC